MSELTHLNEKGEARMVDVTGKEIQIRVAVACGEIRMQADTIAKIQSDQVAKGNVLATARIAAICAAKKTGHLIPLCHPLPISHCEVLFDFPNSRDRILIQASTKIAAQTGVEMEALMAVSIAALTIYDMCKAVDKSMVVSEVRLIKKTKTAYA
jgi:cyclic pyranopterin phosphate synthase